MFLPTLAVAQPTPPSLLPVAPSVGLSDTVICTKIINGHPTTSNCPVGSLAGLAASLVPPSLPTASSINTALGYTPVSPTALATKLPASAAGQPGGVATLGADGKLPTAQAPTVQSATAVVANMAARLNYPASITGVRVFQQDTGADYILSALPATTDTNWTRVNSTAGVTQVAGKTGSVTLAPADVGLSAVNNTADTDKPISTAMNTALSAKLNANVVGAASGVAPLDATGVVPMANIPVASVVSPAPVTSALASGSIANPMQVTQADGGSVPAPVLLTGSRAHPQEGLYFSQRNSFAACLWQNGTLCGQPSAGFDTLAQAPRMQLLQEMQTHYEAPSEWGQVIDAYVNTGRFDLWATSTAYSVGDKRRTAAGNYYIASVAGTSAASGTGPSATSGAVTDGTVTWTWQCGPSVYANCAQKLARNSLVVVGPQGGQTWADDINIVLASGARGPLFRGLEVDFTNVSGVPCGYGTDLTTVTGGDCYGIWAQAGGTYEGTAALEVDSGGGGSNYGWIYGLAIGSGYGTNRNARIADIYDISSGQVAIDTGYDTNAGSTKSHSVAVYRDRSSSPYLGVFSGTYSSAGFNLSAATFTTGVAEQLASNQRICWNGVYGCTSFDGSNFNFTSASGAAIFPLASQLFLNNSQASAIYVGGSHSTAILDTSGTTSAGAPVIIKAVSGQKVCWGGTSMCVYGDTSAGFTFTDTSGNRIARIDLSSGNLILKGQVVPNSTP